MSDHPTRTALFRREGAVLIMNPNITPTMQEKAEERLLLAEEHMVRETILAVHAHYGLQSQV